MGWSVDVVMVCFHAGKDRFSSRREKRTRELDARFGQTDKDVGICSES